MWNKNLAVSVFGMLILTGSGQLAYGQAEKIGNGGDVLVCGNATQFYDLYEGRDRGLVPVSTQGKSFSISLNKILERLKKIDPIRFELYTKSGSVEAKFISDMLIASERIEAGIQDEIIVSKNLQVSRFKNAGIKDLSDEGMIALPDQCELHQLMIQNLKEDYLGFDQLFTVDLKKWSLLSPDDKAAAVMHELIYREAAKKKHQDSRYVRAINQMIFADYSAIDYMKKIIEIDASAIKSQLPTMGYQISTPKGPISVNSVRPFENTNYSVVGSGSYGFELQIKTNKFDQLTSMYIDQLFIDNHTLEVKFYTFRRHTDYTYLAGNNCYRKTGYEQSTCYASSRKYYNKLTYNVSIIPGSFITVTSEYNVQGGIYGYDHQFRLRYFSDRVRKVAIDGLTYSGVHRFLLDANQSVTAVDDEIKPDWLMKLLAE